MISTVTIAILTGIALATAIGVPLLCRTAYRAGAAAGAANRRAICAAQAARADARAARMHAIGRPAWAADDERDAAWWRAAAAE